MPDEPGKEQRKGGKRLSESQDELLIYLLGTGYSQLRAAKKLRIGKATVMRKMQKPEFRERVANVTRGVIGEASAQLSALLNETIETAAAMMRDTDIPANTRAGLIRTVLDHAVRFAEHTGLAAKVTGLETQIEALQESIDAVKQQTDRATTRAA